MVLVTGGTVVNRQVFFLSNVINKLVILVICGKNLLMLASLQKAVR